MITDTAPKLQHTTPIQGCIIGDNPLTSVSAARQARTQGGVVRHPLETAGIDFNSGFRKNGQGGGANRNPKKNPGGQ